MKQSRQRPADATCIGAGQIGGGDQLSCAIRNVL
jgi:hypothetical protein